MAPRAQPSQGRKPRRCRGSLSMGPAARSSVVSSGSRVTGPGLSGWLVPAAVPAGSGLCGSGPGCGAGRWVPSRVSFQHRRQQLGSPDPGGCRQLLGASRSLPCLMPAVPPMKAPRVQSARARRAQRRHPCPGGASRALPTARHSQPPAGPGIPTEQPSGKPPPSPGARVPGGGLVYKPEGGTAEPAATGPA